MSAQLKSAKDALVSSLYELSKAAQEASSATVNFYNASLNTDEEPTKVFSDLADSLRLLTQAGFNVSESANRIAGDTSLAGFPSVTATQPIAGLSPAAVNGDAKPIKKKVERDPYAPKKPLTVFFAYSHFNRERIREARAQKGEPPLSSTEIAQQTSQEWNDMSEAEKGLWKEAYATKLTQYHIDKEAYLEARKRGEQPNTTPTSAPIPIPAHLLAEKEKTKKRDHGSDDKKEKKKKSKKRKSHAPGEGDVTLP